MILDTLDHHDAYQSLGPRFGAGLAWLAKFSPDTADGRYEIDGDHVFALVQSYNTAPAAEKKFEAHRIYADIQYIVAGTEIIQYAPVSVLQPSMEYDGKKDYLLFHDLPVTTSLRLSPGSFAIFYPRDGHKPCCSAESSSAIKKVVIKVRV